MLTNHPALQSRLRPLVGLLVAACLVGSVSAADTPKAVPAGTQIQNIAAVAYVVDGQAYTGSAQVSFVVDQLLDVSATWQNGVPVEAPAGTMNRSLLFRVLNTGNGSDSYALTLDITPDAQHGFTPSQCQLYLDSDHDGIFTQNDKPYPTPSSAPTLDAGNSMDVLAVCTIPEDAPDKSLSNLELRVVSNTLVGAPGDSKPSGAADGMMLVVGMSGDQARATGIYAATNVNYLLSSTQLVTDKFGGHIAYSGSYITYTLIVTPQGTATGRDLVLKTPIPEHTTYVPNSLSLDDTPLTDSATDTDAGDFDASANALNVHLGNVSGTSAARHVRFQVTIN